MPSAITSKITEQSVWLITGCSTGFGHELAKQLLGRGNRVVVTARNTQALTEFAGEKNALVQKLDVTEPVGVTAAVQAAETRFGRIDVLVNNAGIGYFAAVKEGEDEEIRRMFDINLLEALEKLALPRTSITCRPNAFRKIRKPWRLGLMRCRRRSRPLVGFIRAE
jgi:NAD(P)-dependent dehydrogenase (short-subunit alcohol dehydrogenase family)